MFYLTYRPNKLEEIDNSNVQKTIESILKSKKLPHAFLFVGQKGTGKTSAARIFAKSINCLENSFAGKGTSVEPCNTCKNCHSIDKSSSSDVVEMDAASHRGIDEVRALIKESSLLPMHGDYRVFIIDEAHMITNDAFNALLKTLEEPPETVIFILATTNMEKVPKTIQSRCVIINFKKAKKDDVVKMLKRVSKAENLEIEPKLLELIANNSEESFRDAAKLLEELVIQKKLTFKEGETYLGILGKEHLLEVLHKKDLKETLTWIEEFSTAGGNVKYLIEQILEELRILLLAKNGIRKEEREPLNVNFSLIELSRLIKLFQEAYNNLKNTPVEIIPLEIAVVDFYNSRKN
ncbi:DNA polymerase III, subunit gamma and tau [Candidatus Roizmanbacteria bacterium RIFCSPLOWO2_01_FULL_40_42]|uniref:DNA polymerase III subunit gamma/tau n=1 Tax=Candidatus Roizmanbacteria bacterium RIFCSPLOWO2_01_FULL_40_42 TaxID=1802066 RepID=A0A1F7J5I1_9BACT|nr:MAG: DNA polymerase III, subunit gamma and tau [Candidatus Roizmanbacteria bacterium RIFCSPHIGHO2_02_FULL_40_53]OGK30551.1 MAG: DNA polymerase III, subunit gamma and tau [Candidatus Roizmanbacteria bacterium RIFCSPHIGHO2_12_41_18]OGK50871.1 MAG: DNA polymerase III, subunit gamma and tau [Candidatus Roizmanbacteria bacterium RIFCSPLOWO2_01_FULL_40_42]